MIKKRLRNRVLKRFQRCWQVEMWTFKISSLQGYWFIIKWVCALSRVRFFTTPWTVAHQALSMWYSRQEYWRRLPFPTPGDLSNPGMEPTTPVAGQEWIGKWILYHWATWEAQLKGYVYSLNLCQHWNLLERTLIS